MGTLLNYTFNICNSASPSSLLEERFCLDAGGVSKGLWTDILQGYGISQKLEEHPEERCALIPQLTPIACRDAYRNFFQGGGKLGPHKRMTLAIMIIAYIYTSICLLRFALFA